MLAGVVGRCGHAWEDAGDRGGVDDVATAGHHDVGEECTNPVDHTPEVDAHHPLPGLDRAEPWVAGSTHAGVVAHDVHGTETFHRGRGQRIDGLGLADVGDHRVRVHTVRAHLGCGCVQRNLIDVGEHHRTASSSECVGQCQTDPARRPCDHRHLARSEFHQFPLDSVPVSAASDRIGSSAPEVDRTRADDMA